MENKSCYNLWRECQLMFRDSVSEHVYNTWFSEIGIEDLDEEQNTLVLRVPSHYVYEYLEECHIGLLSKVLNSVFKRPGLQLAYRVGEETPSFGRVVDYLNIGKTDAGKTAIAIPDARERLENGLRYYLHDKAKWLECYDKIAEWLSDNKGKGLLCVGPSGLGKSLICRKILPVILGNNVKTVTAREMNTRIDELLLERCVIIDDLGKEQVEDVNYGRRRRPFLEMCDAAEQNGTLLIIATNLSTTPVSERYRTVYPCSIEERYGSDVIDRLRATTKVVVFRGESMR